MDAREMQIAFERKVQLVSPDLALKEKLTSDTIFYFLNAYAERFVRAAYIAEDKLEEDSRALKKNTDSVRSLITRVSLPVQAKDLDNSDKTTDRVELPADYFLYVRSNSIISKNYKTETEIANAANYVVTPNNTIREDNVEAVITTYYNKNILLNPYVVLNQGNNADVTKKGYLNIIHDSYTTIKEVDLVYIRKLKPFNVIGTDGTTILDHCELPENSHMEVVEGAVDMFITEAKYRLNVKPDKEQEQ